MILVSFRSKFMYASNYVNIKSFDKVDAKIQVLFSSQFICVCILLRNT